MTTWDVLQNDAGELLLVETGSGAEVPAGFVCVAVTADPDYLEYMAGLSAEYRVAFDSGAFQ